MRTNVERIRLGYARVSTIRQSDAWGLAAQLSRLETHGLSGDSVVIDDGISTRRTRPALESLRARVRAGEVGAVVVVKLDRLGRSVKELVAIAEELRECGCELVSLTEGIDTSQATGRFLFHILSAVAELEREMISERTRAGLEVARANGRQMGRPVLATEVAEARAVELKAEGLSLRAIGTRLKEEGIPSPSGLPSWSPASVGRCLNRKGTRARGL